MAAGLVYGLIALNKESSARGAESIFLDSPGLEAGMKLALMRVEDGLICLN
ncbi:MAG: hypothetical protein ABSF57_08190 [Acidobacteriaceae bacterium]